ncbi:hypothetical protein VN0916_12200 [Helicobacter pylori]
MKAYIAYKFKTNFVDIVVQTENLKLYLNMKFNELQDKKIWQVMRLINIIMEMGT